MTKEKKSKWIEKNVRFMIDSKGNTLWIIGIIYRTEKKQGTTTDRRKNNQELSKSLVIGSSKYRFKSPKEYQTYRLKQNYAKTHSKQNVKSKGKDCLKQQKKNRSEKCRNKGKNLIITTDLLYGIL